MKKYVFKDITNLSYPRIEYEEAKCGQNDRFISLYDLETGKEVAMTGQYDEMSERSDINYTGGTAAQRKLRDVLKSKMEDNGFTVYEYEWWHYDYQAWKTYRIQNIQFKEITM